MAKKTEYVQVGDLKPYAANVYLKAKIVEIAKPREVSGGRHKVSEALVGDQSGCIYLTLWDGQAEGFEQGNTVHVERGYVSVHRQSMRLTAGKNGTITKVEEEISEVNTENNLSAQRVEQRSRRPAGGSGNRSDNRRSPERRTQDWKLKGYWHQRR